MDIKKYMKVLPAVAALLLTASCDNEDNAVVEEPQQAQSIIIPYEATVSCGSETRATLDGTKYVFQTGDKLFVWGRNRNDVVVIKGELTLDGDGGGTDGTFKGSLTYTPEAGVDDPTTPADDLPLTAVLKGVNDKVLAANVADAIDVAPNYMTGTAATATSNAEAVQMYSYIKDDSYFAYKSFAYLNQYSTFISFEVTLEDGTAAGEPVVVSVKNGTDDLFSGTVTTKNVGGAIKAIFTAGWVGGMQMTDATVTLGSRDPISFGNTTKPVLYANTPYSVTKTYTRYKITASAGTSEKEITSGILLPTESDPFTITMAEVLSKYPTYASYASQVTACQYTSGDNNVEVTGDAPNYTLKAKGVGSSTFTVTIEIGPGYSMDVPVVITVAKMTPPTT